VAALLILASIDFNRFPNFADKNPVSPDLAIALAFGLISTMIGLLGLFIGYLTLRAMTLEISVSLSLHYTTLAGHKINTNEEST
jgi:hypothetical protein